MDVILYLICCLFIRIGWERWTAIDKKYEAFKELKKNRLHLNESCEYENTLLMDVSEV